MFQKIKNWFRKSSSGRRTVVRRTNSIRPTLEALEDRQLLSANLMKVGSLTLPKAVDGQQISKTVLLHVTDSVHGVRAGNLTASVQTGDGTTLTSSANPQYVKVVADPKGGFDVLFSHYTYSEGLNHAAFTVRVRDQKGNHVTRTGMINVAPPAHVALPSQIDGFSLNDGTVSQNNSSVSFDVDVPEIGNVQFTGSYNPSTGQWSLDAYSAGPVEIAGGWVELRDLHLILTNNSLTGDCKASLLGIPELANANMHTQIYSDGRFISTIDAYALHLGGFTLSNTTAKLTNDNPAHEMILTFHSDLGVLGLSVPVDGFIDAQGNYDVKGGEDFTAGGYTVNSAVFELNKNRGLTVAGLVNLPAAGSVNFSGWVHGDGSFELTSTENANLTLDGLSIYSSAGELSLDQYGITISGYMTLPGDIGSTHMHGYLSSDGTFGFSSDADAYLSLDGFTLFSQSGSVSLSDYGNGLSISLSGDLTLPGDIGSVHVYGHAQSDGTFSLTSDADASLSALGFPLSSQAGSITITNNGVSISGDLQLPGLGDVDVSGYVNGDGSFWLSGSNDLTPFGFTLHAYVSISSEYGVKISGDVLLPGLGDVYVSGYAYSDGAFAFFATPQDLYPGGFFLQSATVTIWDNGSAPGSGIWVTGTLYGPVNLSAQVSGYVNGDGSFTLWGDASTSLGGDLAGGSASFTLSADVYGHVNLGIDINAGFSLGGNPSINGSVSGHFDVSDSSFNSFSSGVRATVDLNYDSGYFGSFDYKLADVGVSVYNGGFSIPIGTIVFGGLIPIDVGTIYVNWW